MSFARKIFRFIDVAYDLPQNGRKYKNIICTKDVVYDNRYASACRLDIYRHGNAGDKKLPVILNFHGGGFVAGDKKYREGLAGYYVNKCDVYFVNANYHDCESAPFPQFAQDSVKALKWVIDHAEEYNFDLDNVFIMGDSSGAEMACQLITIITNPVLAEKLECEQVDVKIKGAVMFCGLYDLLDALNQKMVFDLSHKLAEKILGIDFKNEDAFKNHKYINEVSPLEWVNEKFPVSFIGHAKYDIFCPGHAEKLMNKLQEFNVEYVEYKTTKKTDMHCWHLLQHSRSAKKALNASAEYIEDMTAVGKQDESSGVKMSAAAL